MKSEYIWIAEVCMYANDPVLIDADCMASTCLTLPVSPSAVSTLSLVPDTAVSCSIRAKSVLYTEQTFWFILSCFDQHNWFITFVMGISEIVKVVLPSPPCSFLST